MDKGAFYLKEYAHRIGKNRQIQIIGPASPYIGKMKDIYRRVLYLKADSNDMLIHMKDYMEQYIEMNRGFDKIRIQFDFDPVNGF